MKDLTESMVLKPGSYNFQDSMLNFNYTTDLSYFLRFLNRKYKIQIKYRFECEFLIDLNFMWLPWGHDLMDALDLFKEKYDSES